MFAALLPLQQATQYVAFTLSFSGLTVMQNTSADYGYQLFYTANATQLNYPFFLASCGLSSG